MSEGEQLYNGATYQAQNVGGGGGNVVNVGKLQAPNINIIDPVLPQAQALQQASAKANNVWGNVMESIRSMRNLGERERVNAERRAMAQRMEDDFRVRSQYPAGHELSFYDANGQIKESTVETWIRGFEQEAEECKGNFWGPQEQFQSDVEGQALIQRMRDRVGELMLGNVVGESRRQIEKAYNTACQNKDWGEAARLVSEGYKSGLFSVETARGMRRGVARGSALNDVTPEQLSDEIIDRLRDKNEGETEQKEESAEIKPISYENTLYPEGSQEAEEASPLIDHEFDKAITLKEATYALTQDDMSGIMIDQLEKNGRLLVDDSDPIEWKKLQYQEYQDTTRTRYATSYGAPPVMQRLASEINERAESGEDISKDTVQQAMIALGASYATNPEFSQLSDTEKFNRARKLGMIPGQAQKLFPDSYDADASYQSLVDESLRIGLTMSDPKTANMINAVIKQEARQIDYSVLGKDINGASAIKEKVGQPASFLWWGGERNEDTKAWMEEKFPVWQGQYQADTGDMNDIDHVNVDRFKQWYFEPKRKGTGYQAELLEAQDEYRDACAVACATAVSQRRLEQGRIDEQAERQLCEKVIKQTINDERLTNRAGRKSYIAEQQDKITALALGASKGNNDAIKKLEKQRERAKAEEEAKKEAEAEAKEEEKERKAEEKKERKAKRLQQEQAEHPYRYKQTNKSLPIISGYDGEWVVLSPSEFAQAKGDLELGDKDGLVCRVKKGSTYINFPVMVDPKAKRMSISKKAAYSIFGTRGKISSNDLKRIINGQELRDVEFIKRYNWDTTTTK